VSWKQSKDAARERTKEPWYNNPSSRLSPEYRKAYYQNNKEKYREANAKRRALIYGTSAEDRAKCQSFYEEAQRLTAETGVPHEVDHIIPLSRGGTHSPDNLQVITAEQNRKKSNKLD
jgi:5-methylcytosine-specific restriction endonuclease McrA